MVVMALDHVRDFVSSSAGLFEPTDLRQTTPALFLTRWITHFCAPTFVLLAGIGAYQAGRRGRTRGELSWFLASRGGWLILLEVAIVTPLGWSFQLDWSFVRLQVIWAIGCSMVVLSGLVALPSRWVGWAGLAIIAGHNALDGGRGEALGTVWQYLHAIQFWRVSEGHTVASLYPLVPWVGVMMAGYGLGELWTWPTEKRQQWLWRGGLGSLGLFVSLRLTNAYGDPAPWTGQRDVVYTCLSLLNVTKYPPSLLFLALTLGVGLLALWAREKRSRGTMSWLQSFGRVPLFFYLLHLPLIHGAAIVLSYWNHGAATWLWRDPFALRRGAGGAPADYGFGLGGVYVLWVLCIAGLFPLCRWYGSIKEQSRRRIWSYL